MADDAAIAALLTRLQGRLDAMDLFGAMALLSEIERQEWPQEPTRDLVGLLQRVAEQAARAGRTHCVAHARRLEALRLAQLGSPADAIVVAKSSWQAGVEAYEAAKSIERSDDEVDADCAFENPAPSLDVDHWRDPETGLHRRDLHAAWLRDTPLLEGTRVAAAGLGVWLAVRLEHADIRQDDAPEIQRHVHNLLTAGPVDETGLTWVLLAIATGMELLGELAEGLQSDVLQQIAEEVGALSDDSLAAAPSTLVRYARTEVFLEQKHADLLARIRRAIAAA